ncbi:MAG: hypothetical protein NVS3B18_11320 [Candidatus Dormibacteria bacterium]
MLALVLASLAVSLGLLMSTKRLLRRAPDLLAAHEVLSLTTIAAIVVHGVALLGDGYLKASLVDIAVPFAFSYKTFWTSLGIVSGYGLALLGLTYYLRRYIGAARWRSVHRLTVVVWLAGLGHALGEGTDASQPWFLVMLATVLVPAPDPAGRSPHVPGTPAGTAQSPERGDIRTVPASAVPTAGVAVCG